MPPPTTTALFAAALRRTIARASSRSSSLTTPSSSAPGTARRYRRGPGGEQQEVVAELAAGRGAASPCVRPGRGPTARSFTSVSAQTTRAFRGRVRPQRPLRELPGQVVGEARAGVVAVRIGADQDGLAPQGRRRGSPPRPPRRPAHHRSGRTGCAISGLLFGGRDRGAGTAIGSNRRSPRGQRFTHSPQVRQRPSTTGSPRHTCRRTSMPIGQLNEQTPHWTQRLGSGSTQAVARSSYSLPVSSEPVHHAQVHPWCRKRGPQGHPAERTRHVLR